MPLDAVTFGTLLRDAGYTTGYFGKFHHDNQKERPGFDVVYSFVGQGRYIDCPVLVNGKETPTKGWIDDVTTDFAIDFLKDRKEADKPFAMVVGFKSPHGPRTPPERAKNRFEGQSPRPVPNLDVRAPWAPKRIAEDSPQPKAREGLLDYFRVISAVDDNIGRILDTLDQQKLADNTVVVFTSDNGYYFGEHGLSDKRSAYEESLRIPMIIRFPKSIPAGKTMDEMVLNIDVAPTFLDYAGVAIPAEIQGKSLRGVLEHKLGDWRQSFFYEYFHERKYVSPTITAVRTTDAKLIKYPGHEDWNELFDLKSDPYELKNLIKSDEALLKKMQAEFDAQSRAVGYVVPAFADKADE
jgi:arylsulfatase A-like enzyme